MPHFDEFGGDEWVCQICGKIQNSRVIPVWRTDVTGHESAGNVCPKCMELHERSGLTSGNLRELAQHVTGHGDRCSYNSPISLAEHCQRESGGLTGEALKRYINRYYGHG